MNSYFFVSKSNLQAVICKNVSCLVSNATTLSTSSISLENITVSIVRLAL